MKYIIIVGLSLLIVAIGNYLLRMHNPYSEVEWIHDYPGAGERYSTYVPVLKSNHAIELGPVVGADFATLRFEDTDGDGTKEAIIHSNAALALEAYSPGLFILKHRLDSVGRDNFYLIKSEELPTIY